MKFYEIHDPYYALIKAENKESAKEKYIKHIAEDDGSLDINEVSREYALAKFAQAPGENKKLIPVEEVVDEFLCQENEVLIIDGSLI
ncbi:hypothetical protein [Cytobacillus horneckiae]|uniref:Uncharacterized protein n=1 Tax=Cytobacillus horneckiae TaxID=549687 RepID=A0A2N0ZMZ0_9BACI|nr:hypothetical protein [Cytobacillus horneckiae]PKG30868.1 hypothetical protein CWS20_01235 [Cytobacillus horneckiae]